jgi:hypothetical protein
MASSRSETGRYWPRLSSALAVVALLVPVVAGCGSSSDTETISLPPAPPKPAAAAAVTTASAPQPTAGFTPLPTPQQVVAALPTGRVDPFAPLPQPGSKPGAAPAADLRFTGVIRSAGQAQALVQVGEQTGAVCVGRRGVCPGSGLPALLPPDWSVTSIDVASGRLVLNQAGQRRVFSL